MNPGRSRFLIQKLTLQVARSVVNSASAAFAFNSASCAACSSSGLVNSKMTVSVFHLRARTDDNFFDAAFGVRRNPSNLFRNERSEPRTCRTIGPRFTVSIHTVERSTLGTAGFKRDNATVIKISPGPRPETMRMRRFLFLRAT